MLLQKWEGEHTELMEELIVCIGKLQSYHRYCTGFCSSHHYCASSVWCYLAELVIAVGLMRYQSEIPNCISSKIWFMGQLSFSSFKFWPASTALYSHQCIVLGLFLCSRVMIQYLKIWRVYREVNWFLFCIYIAYMSSPCHIEVILSESETAVAKADDEEPAKKKESKKKLKRQKMQQRD